MKLINPSVLISNAEGPHWLVSFEHHFNADEKITLQVKVLKSDHSFGAVQREAFERCQELLQLAVDNLR